MQKNLQLHTVDASSQGGGNRGLGNDAASELGNLETEAVKQMAEIKEAGAASILQPFGSSFGGRILAQLLFGVLYYCLIVAQYPELDPRWGKVIGAGAPNDAARQLQRECEVFALFSVSCSNNFFSLCCSGPRGAQTFHATGIMNYWLGLILMSCFPCCTLCYTNACTDLNEKLGGRPRGCCMSMLCAWLCFCCVIAQDAESLDLVTGCKTGFCGVEMPKDYQFPRNV